MPTSCPFAEPQEAVNLLICYETWKKTIIAVSLLTCPWCDLLLPITFFFIDQTNRLALVSFILLLFMTAGSELRQRRNKEQEERESNDGGNGAFSSTSSLSSARIPPLDGTDSASPAKTTHDFDPPLPGSFILDDTPIPGRRKQVKLPALTKKRHDNAIENEDNHGNKNDTHPESNGNPIGKESRGSFSQLPSTRYNFLALLRPEPNHGPKKPMTREQVFKEESKLRKIVVRVVYGVCLFALFCGTVCIISCNEKS